VIAADAGSEGAGENAHLALEGARDGVAPLVVSQRTIHG
jgi:hypothetical protein